MNENELLSFYRKLCTIMDLEVNANDQLFVKIDNTTNAPLLINRLPVYLPTDNNIASMSGVDDLGNPKKIKELFNPLSENAIKGGNTSYNKLRTVLELKLLGVFYVIGETLLVKIANSKEEINDISLMKFSALLSRFKTTAKTLVDQKTVDNWSKVYEEIVNQYIAKKYIGFTVTKGGKIEDIKYNRIGVITFPLGEEIFKLDNKNNNLLDVNLRNKDIHAFKSLYEFIVGNEQTTKDGIQNGSLNKVAPSTHTLLIMYDKVYKMLADVIESIHNLDIDTDTKEKVTLHKLPFAIENLSTIIDGLEQEIRRVPTEATVNNEPTLPNLVNSSVPNVNTNIPATTGSFWDKASMKQSTPQFNPQVNTSFNTPQFNQPNINPSFNTPQFNPQVNPSFSQPQQPVLTRSNIPVQDTSSVWDKMEGTARQNNMNRNNNFNRTNGW